ncbi:hypothetical protein [Dulcicalothrix desertica]|nr:hypothetical protein [Dulcicalothrix desertica]TWH43874.1 hypothetical protein CAL7102_07622 [Dulcicalothrix desertica PCC 7102]
METLKIEKTNSPDSFQKDLMESNLATFTGTGKTEEEFEKI